MMRATFYFDLGSPYAYLAAERIAGDDVLPAESVAWQPLSLGALFKLAGRSSWSLGDPERRREGIAEVRAARRALRPAAGALARAVAEQLSVRDARLHLRFPAGPRPRVLPPGLPRRFPAGPRSRRARARLDARRRGRSRPAGGRGRDRGSEVKLALRAATQDAHELGVFGVPTVAVGDELFWGDDRLQDAAAALG